MVRPSAGPMFAALYGELTPHAWHDPEHDAYQLFHQRSLAMGWLDGLWGMNDAGWEHPGAAPGAGLAAWFQVGAGPVPGDRPLPVQPFLRCAADTAERVGRLRVSAVQVLLPVQGLDPAARPPYAPVPSMQTVHWFAERDPESRTAVEVAVSGGREPAVPALAPRLAERLRQLDQDVFVCGSHEAAGPQDLLAPPFDDSFWNGPGLHGVVLRGELVEWSCEAVGWLAETLADLVAGLGARSPLLLTVARAG
ncbi:hypothetical protein [Streptomyces sp. NK08204]|uniref:hypothetical protein n=1 Tax=Streptomyces sp. NK08204 TaxID=2873260 RepID=UPI001CEDA4FE|nr:hypothetical protein [Streptomyces sp. NK08204]